MNLLNLTLLLLLQFTFVFDKTSKAPESSPVTDSPQKEPEDKVVAANIIFKSTDDGQTWMDISEGLPANLLTDGFERDGFMANDTGLFLRTGNGIYHSKPNSSAPFWQKEMFPNKQGSITSGKNGILAYNYSGQFLQRINNTGLWMPMYTNFPQKLVRTVFETRGAAFIGCDNGLFRSTDSGKTWERVYDGGWVMKMVESNNVLLATSESGIIRSTDGGENWDNVISEGGVGIAIERIKGGFAAITCNTESETRRVRTSYDGGKTWQAIDAGMPASLYIASITEVGEYLFCGHPDGIYRSSDKGKTWKLALPAIPEKVFNLTASGKVIYAIPRSGGC